MAGKGQNSHRRLYVRMDEDLVRHVVFICSWVHVVVFHE